MAAEVNDMLSRLGRSAFPVSIHAAPDRKPWIDFWVAAGVLTQNRAGFSDVFSRVAPDTAYALTALTELRSAVDAPWPNPAG